MPAPPLDCIRAEVVERFRVVLAQDDAASTFPDLLGAEEQLTDARPEAWPRDDAGLRGRTARAGPSASATLSELYRAHGVAPAHALAPRHFVRPDRRGRCVCLLPRLPPIGSPATWLSRHRSRALVARGRAGGARLGVRRVVPARGRQARAPPSGAEHGAHDRAPDHAQARRAGARVHRAQAQSGARTGRARGTKLRRAWRARSRARRRHDSGRRARAAAALAWPAARAHGRTWVAEATQRQLLAGGASWASSRCPARRHDCTRRAPPASSTKPSKICSRSAV